MISKILFNFKRHSTGRMLRSPALPASGTSYWASAWCWCCCSSSAASRKAGKGLPRNKKKGVLSRMNVRAELPLRLPLDKDVPYRSLLFPKNSIYSLGSVYRIFQADARHPPSSLIKNQGADTSHHECVVSAPWFSECLISGRCSTETAHMLPGYPPADVSKSRPAVPAASRKKLRQCRR